MVNRSDDAANTISTGKINSTAVENIILPDRRRLRRCGAVWVRLVNKAQMRKGAEAPFRKPKQAAIAA
jgi:hypothetical protein